MFFIKFVCGFEKGKCKNNFKIIKHQATQNYDNALSVKNIKFEGGGEIGRYLIR